MKKNYFMLLVLLGTTATMSAQQVDFTVRGGTNYEASSNDGCEKAFDHNLETKWLSESGDSYVDIEASEKVRLMGFTLVTADGNEQSGHIPYEWEFWGTNDETALGNEINKWGGWTKLENVRNDNVVQQKNYTAHYYSINAPSTGYKYFRLKFVNSPWQLSEIIPAYAREYQPPYIALDGYGATGESFYNLFDNNTGSKWCQGDWGEGDKAENALWWVVFKTSSPIAVSGYTFTTANDANGRDPKSWTLYGSNSESQPGKDDGSWEMIDSKTDQSFTTERFTDVRFDVDNSTTAYKYFKLEITKVRDNGSMTQISEFRLDGLGYNDTEDKLISYRSMDTWGDGSASYLFDGNPDTKFGGGFKAPTDGHGSYVTFGHASQKQISITGYSMLVANEGYYNRIPKSWTLYGCNDGNEPERNWEVIHTVMDDGELVRNGDSRLTRGYYHLDAPSKPYKYFKIVFTEVCSGGDLQLAELVLYYPHEKVMTNWLELREETSPVFCGVPTVNDLKIKRSIAQDKWVGLCLPFDYSIPDGWDVRELDHVNGSGETANMIFDSASDIKAGKPYIVKTNADVSLIEVSNATISPMTTTVSKNGVNMIGNIGQTSIPDGSYYISTDGTLKKLMAENANLKGFRAYFTVDEASGIKALNLGIENDATGISSVDANESEVIYNIAGQRLKRVQKGINIVNGKKVLY